MLVVNGESGHRLTSVEQSSLEDLGEMVGQAISAARTKRALTTDSAVEVEFDVGAADHCLAAASEHHGEITLEGTVDIDGAQVGVFSVPDGDLSAVCDIADRAGTVERTELVETEDGDGLLEVEFADTAFHNIVANRGGVVRGSVSEDGSSQIRAELLGGTEVRDVLDALQSEYPTTALTAQRNVARPIRTDRAVGEQVDEELSERQRTALKTAYLTGYYDIPRQRTGEEIAETMGVSGPTFHKHLRLGERKLIETYLDSRATDRPRQ